MNRERVTKLRDALASGKWQKTTGKLHRKISSTRPIGHCCQGVGCELALRDQVRGFDLATITEGVHTYYNDEIYVWPNEVQEYFGFTLQQGRDLMMLNDDDPYDKWSNVIDYLNDLLKRISVWRDAKHAKVG